MAALLFAQASHAFTFRKASMTATHLYKIGTYHHASMSFCLPGIKTVNVVLAAKATFSRILAAKQLS